MRKGKYSKEVTDKIASYIAEGYTQDGAASMADIHISTFHNWLNNKPEFFEAIKKAHEQRKAKWVKCIQNAAMEPKTWQAAAWLLERFYPDDFAKRDASVNDAPLVRIVREDQVTNVS